MYQIRPRFSLLHCPNQREFGIKEEFVQQSFCKMSRFLTKKKLCMKNWGKGPALMSSMWWLSLLMTELPSKRITKGPGHPQRLPQDTRKVTTMKPSPLISLGLSWIHNSLFFSFWVFPGCKAGNELAELVVRPLLQMKAAAAAVRWLSANTYTVFEEGGSGESSGRGLSLSVFGLGKETMGRIL